MEKRRLLGVFALGAALCGGHAQTWTPTWLPPGAPPIVRPPIFLPPVTITNTPPAAVIAIVEQPAAGTLFGGETALLKVRAEATAGSSLQYQWSHNDVPLAAGTNATLEIVNFGASDVGAYSVRVVNDKGTNDSRVVHWSLASVVGGKLLDIDFTAHLNPVFSTKTGPAAVGVDASDFWNVYSRDTTSLAAWRSGGAVSNLKWTDGSNSGANLIVTNAGGAWFTLCADPMMQSYLYPLDRQGNISAKLTGLPAQRYDIYVYAHGQPSGENATVTLTLNGVPVDTRVTSSLTAWDSPGWIEGNQYVLFRGVEAPAGSEIGIVSAGGASGLAVINGAQLASAPSTLAITTQPVSATINLDAPLRLSVVAQGSGTLTYQWFKDNAAIIGATTSTYFVDRASAADVGSYYVQVRNGVSITASDLAVVAITGGGGGARPTISANPTSATIFAGDTARLSVTATGEGLHYRWLKNGAILPDQSETMMEIANFAPANVGAYKVQISNSAGFIESDVATLELATRAEGRLINVDYTAHLNPAFSTKMGPAAVGFSYGDAWNKYSRDVSSLWDWRADGTIADLFWSDGASSGASLSVTNAEGAWNTLLSDPMMYSYLYPLTRSGSIGSRFSNLPARHYDIYVYAHGQPASENAVIDLFVGGSLLGSKTTSYAAGWDAPGWIEDNVYVVFHGVDVPAGSAVDVVSKPGQANLAVINGVQIVPRDGFEAQSIATGLAKFTGRSGVGAQFAPWVSFGANLAPQVLFTGYIGVSYFVEASSDMKTWKTIGTYTSLDGSVQVEDTDGIGAATRYYRATVLP